MWVGRTGATFEASAIKGTLGVCAGTTGGSLADIACTPSAGRVCFLDAGIAVAFLLNCAGCFERTIFDTLYVFMCLVHVGAGALLQNAPQLKMQTPSLSLLQDDKSEPLWFGGVPLFLVDEDAMLVHALQSWIDTLDSLMGKTGCAPLPPLLLSGLIKVSSC